MPWEATGPDKAKGRAEDGDLYEQPVRIVDADEEENESALEVRRIRLVLDEPTRDGDTEIVVLTNLPEEDASAQKIASLYRRRWTIERAFQELSDHLEAATCALGYPKVAFFGFAVGFVSYNVLSVLKSTLASVYGRQAVEEEISGYYIAGEIAKTREGLMIALPPERWSGARKMPLTKITGLLQKVAGNADLNRYRKHPRKPKKPPPQRTTNRSKPHVSTAKLLARRRNDS